LVDCVGSYTIQFLSHKVFVSISVLFLPKYYEVIC
jgi:hypothetical protein